MFPLFQTLFKQTESQSTIISIEERLKLSEQINSLDKTAHEYIYAMIRNYQLEIDKEMFDELPYNVRVQKNGYKWEMQKLPSRLVVMIKHFVELHLEKINEETQRSNFF